MSKNIKVAFLFSLTVLFSIPSFSGSEKTDDTIRVAVLDTGFDFKSNWKKYDITRDTDGKLLTKPKLCDSGHKDFTGKGLQDSNSHGTHVAGTIAKYAGNSDYCLIIIKTYIKEHANTPKGISMVEKGLSYAESIDVDIINYSGGGKSFSIEEYLTVKKILDKGIVLVTAAGNEKEIVNHHILKVDINFTNKSKTEIDDFQPYYIHRKTSKVTTEEPDSTYYPAAYDPRVIAVTNVNRDGDFHALSNKGAAFTFKEMGVGVLSLLPNNSIGYLTGTSQSTAIRTGKIIKSWHK